jgi:HK97 gp10 family phage protein
LPRRRKTLELNQDGIRRLATSDEIAAVVEKAAEAIAADARMTAPRGKGKHGADSIRHVMVTDERDQPEGRVSWGKRFGFHMSFQEFGTSKTPAHAFLRNSANKRRSL